MSWMRQMDRACRHLGGLGGEVRSGVVPGEARRVYEDDSRLLNCQFRAAVGT